MALSQLQNYVRSNRKRLALSQGELAFLLGTQSGARVCRDERFIREMSLKTALAYEAIFQKPVRELFAGLYHDIEHQVTVRAKTMADRLNEHKATRQREQKHRALADIIAAHSKAAFN